LVKAIEDKKGEDILLLDIHEISDFTNYFIICSGTSNRMLNSLIGVARETAKKEYGLVSIPEGDPDSGWVALDLGNVVVHAFSPELRAYYQLEELWSEGKILLHLQ
jgi:ribosome-associated protein